MYKPTDTIIIDYDAETMLLLNSIVNKAIEAVYNSGIPVDLSNNKSITKLKTLGMFYGTMTIKLPNVIQYEDDALDSYGILAVKEFGQDEKDCDI